MCQLEFSCIDMAVASRRVEIGGGNTLNKAACIGHFCLLNFL